MKKMLMIAIRTDATSQIGTGHFMRCLTLADILKQRGAHICFICRDLPMHLIDMLAAKGMELSILGREAAEVQMDGLVHSHWLGASQAQDAKATLQTLSGQVWDWLVVDHYALNARWEGAVRAGTKQLMVIDDLADRQHDCDVLLDQNFYVDMQTRYIGKVPAHCQLLLGPRYALLREEFRRLRERVKPRTGKVKRMLVFFGGVDSDNYTSLAIQALAELKITLQVDVVIGALHPNREQIQQACIVHDYSCHVQTLRIAELMAEADLAIGAGGSATWERCCLGLPTISLCGAENQRKQIADAAEVGLLYSISSNDSVVDAIRSHTLTLLENSALLKHISHTQLNAVDGKGLLRIVNAMGVSGVGIRPVNQQDTHNLFAWRNHPAIRAVSRNNSLIAWEVHQRWFASVIADPDRVLLIGSIDEQPIGVVRFDKENDVAEVSIYLVPDGDFVCQGSNLLQSAERWIRTNRSDIKSIQASVLGNNEASNKLFLSSDYRVQMICYEKDL